MELAYLHDWNVILVPDGLDFDQILAAQQTALRMRNSQPTAIVYRTQKGWQYGVEGKASHGAGHGLCTDGFYQALNPLIGLMGGEPAPLRRGRPAVPGRPGKGGPGGMFLGSPADRALRPGKEPPDRRSSGPKTGRCPPASEPARQESPRPGADGRIRLRHGRAGRGPYPCRTRPSGRERRPPCAESWAGS